MRPTDRVRLDERDGRMYQPPLTVIVSPVMQREPFFELPMNSEGLRVQASPLPQPAA
jgi:hypothetical protein